MRWALGHPSRSDAGEGSRPSWPPAPADSSCPESTTRRRSALVEAREVPLNLAGPRRPPIRPLAALGVARVSLGSSIDQGYELAGRADPRGVHHRHLESLNRSLRLPAALNSLLAFTGQALTPDGICQAGVPRCGGRYCRLLVKPRPAMTSPDHCDVRRRGVFSAPIQRLPTPRISSKASMARRISQQRRGVEQLGTTGTRREVQEIGMPGSGRRLGGLQRLGEGHAGMTRKRRRVDPTRQGGCVRR